MSRLPKNTTVVGVFAGTLSLLIAGCPTSMGPRESPAAAEAVSSSGISVTTAETPTKKTDSSPGDLRDEVDRVLRQNLEGRALATDIHGGWQILHGILAYGKEFQVVTANGNVPAVDYLQKGGRVAGFEPILGDTFDVDGQDRRGLRMELQPSTKIGQGHRDQWLAVIAQSGMKADDTIQYAGHTYTMDDWVRQVEYDIPLNFETEFSWTLIGLLAYRDTDHSWTARDGNTYNIASLLESELMEDFSASACGGTHRLIGIAKAVNKRRAEGKALLGVWKEAENALTESIALAKQNQNPDGSFSVAYHHRTGWTRDLGEALGTTGHVLEFIATAADAETLQQPWVARSVDRLNQILDQCEDIDLECGALYHALHGLVEYQNQVTK